jgi:hypothetical protein
VVLDAVEKRKIVHCLESYPSRPVGSLSYPGGEEMEGKLKQINKNVWEDGKMDPTANWRKKIRQLKPV